ncbi:MAG: helix-turn-helix domain-containing protein [Anaerolineales bacterium]
MPAAPEWLSLSEAAEILGVHPSTVRNWSDQGLLPVYRTGGKHRRYKKNEVELWAATAREGKVLAPVSAMQAAVGQVRVQIAEGRLQEQTWYRKLDSEARLQYRYGGMALVNGLMGYLSSDDESQAAAEAHSIGYEYASRARRYNLSMLEAVQAYLFFRNTLLDAVMHVYQDANIPSGAAWGSMLKKVNAYTDQVMLSLLETYQAFEEAHQ